MTTAISKHTPGPWKLREDFMPSESGTVEVYHEEDNIWLASVLGTHVGPKVKEEVIANAKLMAAAPDMYDAIKLALDIKDLWAPAGSYTEQHESEAQALQQMLLTLEAVMKKIA